VALFRVDDLSDPKHRFKVDVNAQQCFLTGTPPPPRRSLARTYPHRASTLSRPLRSFSLPGAAAGTVLLCQQPDDAAPGQRGFSLVVVEGGPKVHLAPI